MQGYRTEITNPIDLKALSWWQVSCAIGALLFLWMIDAAYDWHVHHDPHSVATVSRTFIIPASGKRSKRLGAMMQFDRTNWKGSLEHCTTAIDIGDPNDDVRVGDRFDVVPRGYCGRIYVISQLSRGPGSGQPASTPR